MITVLFFGWAKELAGISKAEFEVGDSRSLDGLWSLLLERFPSLAPHRKSFLLAVNQTYAGADVSVQAGDEVAVIPPVSGG